VSKTSQPPKPSPSADPLEREEERTEAAASEEARRQIAQEEFEEAIKRAGPIPQVFIGSRRSSAGWVAAGEVAADEVQEPISWSPQGRLVVAAIEEALSTPECTEIHSYGPSHFSAKVDGQNALLHGLSFASVEEYLRFIRDLVIESAGQATWTAIREMGQGVVQMRDGARLAIMLPRKTDWPIFAIRKHTAVTWEPEVFVEKGTLDLRMLRFLQACVAARCNILIVGPMGSGKTSLLRALAQSIGDNERIAVCEQVPELAISKPLAIAVHYRTDIPGETLEDVLDLLLYASIDRLIVGEVHFQGITKMLEVMTITEGSLSTYHATSAEQAGERMRVALQLENANFTPQAALSLLRQTIDLVIVLDKVDGVHRCKQIMEIDWRSMHQGMLNGSNLFVWSREDQRYIARNRPDERGRILDKAQGQGVRIDHNWFLDPYNMPPGLLAEYGR
jgi:type IV secretory pathway ATPase VirB11/archaellum biosynthesis ATPase